MLLGFALQGNVELLRGTSNPHLAERCVRRGEARLGLIGVPFTGAALHPSGLHSSRLHSTPG